MGSLDEAEVATGIRDPLAAGVELAIVKQGSAGVLGMTVDEVVEVTPVEVEDLLSATAAAPSGAVGRGTPGRGERICVRTTTAG